MKKGSKGMRTTPRIELGTRQPHLIMQGAVQPPRDTLVPIEGTTSEYSLFLFGNLPNHQKLTDRLLSEPLLSCFALE